MGKLLDLVGGSGERDALHRPGHRRYFA